MTPDAISAVARAIRKMYPRRDVRIAAGHVTHTEATASYAELYRNDAVGFLRNVLQFYPTPAQEKIARALPGRVKVNSGHGTGKTVLAAALALWWFYTRDPGIVITTAPTKRDVEDLLWTEVRILSSRSGLPQFWKGPSAPEMYDHPEHWAKGYTASRGESFQGRHRPSMFFIFDESEAVDPPYWITLNTMYQPGPEDDHAALAIGNPTTTSSQSYLEDMATLGDGRPKWKPFILSCLDHPNIEAELKGLPRPIPHAVTLEQVSGYVSEWCSSIPPDTREDLDFQWPPGSGIWYRPGPNFKGRVLGIRPTEGVDTVWSTKVFESACTPRWQPRECWLRNYGITVGIDAGGYGCFDDATEILTDLGWLPFAVLQGTERVLTRKPDGVACWEIVEKVHRYPFDGHLNLYEGERLNFCITDNHKLLARSVHQKEFRLAEYNELPNEFVVGRSNGWEGTEIPPVTFSADYPTPHGGFYQRTWTFDPMDWCAFLGWFISEGNVYKTKSGKYQILIAQITSDAKVEEIKQLLTRMRLRFRYNGRQFRVHSRPIAEHLLKECGHGAARKQVPSYVKNASSAQMSTFLTSFCKGDGSFRGKQRLSYFTSSLELANDLQEMLVKLGTSGKMWKRIEAGSTFSLEGRTITRQSDGYILTERASSQGDHWVLKRKVIRQRYTGVVYCVSTPYKTICVRRGGQVMWSGNSDDTAIHVRSGPLALHHESRNGWEPGQAAGRAKELIFQWTDWYNALAELDRPPHAPADARVVLEFDGGYGVGVHSHRGDEFPNWYGIHVGGRSEVLNPLGFFIYANLRAELWFEGAAKAKGGQMDLSRLPQSVLDKLRIQLVTPFYENLPNGQKRVEPKREVKKRLGRSPDDADSLLVCHYEVSQWGPLVVGDGRE